MGSRKKKKISFSYTCSSCGQPVRNKLRAKGKRHSTCRWWNQPPSKVKKVHKSARELSR